MGIKSYVKSEKGMKNTHFALNELGKESKILPRGSSQGDALPSPG